MAKTFQKIKNWQIKNMLVEIQDVCCWKNVYKIKNRKIKHFNQSGSHQKYITNLSDIYKERRSIYNVRFLDT